MLMQQQLDGFLRSDLTELTFASTLGAEERRFLHSMAPKLGLASKSRGSGDQRAITVSKPARTVAAFLNVFCRF